LVDGTGLVANREFFLANRKFVEAYPEIIDDLTKAVDEASVWAKQQPRAVAELLSMKSVLKSIPCSRSLNICLGDFKRLLRP
jgi:ABC-type nitrate/sulfonate/bicarbonate transport system substrate-binding protein